MKWLEASTGVLMSQEGLNQRFNPTAVAFLREVFTLLLTQKLCATYSFQLPDSFATDYQGSGGSSNTAGVEIQLE
jgi:hypothetical protein